MVVIVAFICICSFLGQLLFLYSPYTGRARHLAAPYFWAVAVYLLKSKTPIITRIKKHAYDANATAAYLDFFEIVLVANSRDAYSLAVDVDYGVFVAVDLVARCDCETVLDLHSVVVFFNRIIRMHMQNKQEMKKNHCVFTNI